MVTQATKVCSTGLRFAVHPFGIDAARAYELQDEQLFQIGQRRIGCVMEFHDGHLVEIVTVTMVKADQGAY